ncbi:MAG TPA: BMP family ABC transporter substrate-binding protein [Acidimicrobiia bacterium]|nr:BMP family ABC transporter substrate-binding protein [Acidimicrobiia bacterium]
MKRYTRLLAILAVLGLVLAACSPADEGGDETTTTGAGEPTTSEAMEGTTTSEAMGTTTTGATAEMTPVKVCFVTDDAGVDDRSFNASGWQGVQDAIASGAATDDAILLESASEADYQPHIETCLAQGAEHIVTSGFKLAGSTETFAAANTDIQWTIIDFASVGPNVAGTEFQTDEAAFAAGYLAAGVTQTGTVATYGGQNIPTVAIFLDGFARGVAHYNEVKGADVQVLGWDVEAQDGTMTGTFDPADPLVRSTCESQLDEGADIILPVGGAINLPCGTAIQDRGIDGALVGVDADAFDAMPAEYQDLWLVTILKGLALGVTSSIEAHASGAPLGGSSYVGNLANDGVGLSDYHSWADRVPAELDAEVQQILADIESGAITWDKFVVGGG